jgi:hypothetical protein
MNEIDHAMMLWLALRLWMGVLLLMLGACITGLWAMLAAWPISALWGVDYARMVLTLGIVFFPFGVVAALGLVDDGKEGVR